MGLRNDDIAVYNAQEMINICQRLTLEGNSDITPSAETGELTPTVEVTP